MRFTRILHCVPVLGALILPAIALAGQLDRSRVGADAQWLAHFDVEAIAKSKIVQYLMEHGAEMDVDINALSALKLQFGIDPLKDIKDITVYGLGNPEDHNGVILLTATKAIDDAIESLKSQGDAMHETQVNGQTVRSFDADGTTAYFVVRPTSAEGDRRVVLAAKQDKLLQGIEVLEGKRPNLAATPSKSVGSEPKPGSMLFASAMIAPWMAQDNHEEGDKDDTGSELLRQCDHLSFDLGESGPDTYLSATLAGRTPEDATNMGDLVRGLVAMGRMAVKSEPDLAVAKDLINSVKITTAQAETTISFKHSTDDLIKLVNTIAQSEKEHHEHHASSQPATQKDQHADHHGSESHPQ
jgi:hypothetical protein